MQTDTWFFALVVIGGASIIATFIWHLLLSLIFWHPPFHASSDTAWLLTGPVTGIVERAFFTLIIGLDIPGAGVAMLIWITLKAQSHYNVLNVRAANSPQTKDVYVSLLGSLGSLACAAIAGSMVA